MQMKKEMKKICLALSVLGLLTSCFTDEHEFGLPSKDGESKGTLVLNLNANAEFSSTTRAVNESSYTNVANYTVEITDQDGKTYTCTGADASTWQKKLPIGICSVKAYYGEEAAASRDNFYMLGESSVTIEPDATASVQVDCYPTCAKLRVAFDSEMATYFDNYSVDFAGTAKLAGNKFSWAKADSAPYYVAINKGDAGEQVTFTVNLTAKDEYVSVIDDSKSKTGTVTGTFTLKRQDFYTLKVKPSYIPPVGPEEGSISIEISIDATTVDHNVSYEVPVAWI